MYIWEFHKNMRPKSTLVRLGLYAKKQKVKK